MSLILKIKMMKAENKATAEQLKILRKFEKHCKKQANLRRQDNTYNTWDKTRNETYKKRKQLSKKARYEGLARQFLRGVHYHLVENKTRENNEPRVSDISFILSEWGVNHYTLDLDMWLEGVLSE